MPICKIDNVKKDKAESHEMFAYIFKNQTQKYTQSSFMSFP